MRAVLKLGGSLAASATLQSWLRTALACGRGRLVIVPGGGPFADEVRRLQRRMRLSDEVSHRMAILAMQQFGLAIESLAPGLEGADSRAAIERVLRRRRVAVWLPSRMLDRASDIRPGWDVTSDSLAAWLAERLRAQLLVVVKSCRIDSEDPRELARRRVVDEAFPRVVARCGARVAIVGRSSWRRLPCLLDATSDPA